MDDWSTFTSAVPWFAPTPPAVPLGDPHSHRQLDATTRERFPNLTLLLKLATVTDIGAGGTSFELLAWNGSDGQRTGWLCAAPNPQPPANLFVDHQHLLRGFGGIIEQFNEPDTWLLNHDEALTEQESKNDLEFFEHYAWIFEGADWPINKANFHSIALESNGNTTLCHRETGEIILFASDHDFDHVTPFEGCPDQSLYRINETTNFRDWVETIAKQWLYSITP